MTLGLKILKGSFAMSLAEGLSYGASFVRNVILARMLTKADFGVAATFAMVISLLEFSSKLGLSRHLMQAKAGDQEDFAATAHLCQFGFAAVSALAIFLLAGPLASVFGLSQAAWAFQLLALQPLFRGLSHLDVYRMAREMRFVPLVLQESVPQVLATVAAWPLALWLPDYRAVLILMLAKESAGCLMSHLLTERRYQWRACRVFLRGMIRFSWPLFLTSFLMFGTYQGDRFLVGTYYSMDDLGLYSVAATLVLAPVSVIIQVFASVLLPPLAKAQSRPAEFRQRYTLCLQAAALVSALYGSVLIIGGESLIVLIFGSRYAGGGAVMSWLAVANSFRILRVAPCVASLAQGDSKNDLLANTLRVTGLLPAFLAAGSGKALWVLAACSVIGEAIACVGTFLRFSRRNETPIATSLLPTALTAILVLVSGFMVAAGVAHGGWPVALAASVLVSGTGVLAMLRYFDDLRRGLWGLLRQLMPHQNV